MNQPRRTEPGMTDNNMWFISKEQAAQAAIVLVVYPDGVFGFTHNGINTDDVGHALRRVSDHILGNAIVEARTDL